MPDEEEILKEIRENFDYALEAWREIREQGSIDMRYVAGDPWDPKERKARGVEGQERLCLSFDELGQFTNQVINDVRMNKRAVAVAPKGSGADDDSAELRGNVIRNIEYESNAQAAYTRAFEDAIQRSYGYAKVVKRYVSPDSFDQELRIQRVPNPDAILIDPDCKEADFSDMKYAFEIDRIRQSTFKKLYPKAKVTDFSSTAMSTQAQWLGENDMQIASYWCVKTKSRKLLKFENETGQRLAIFEDDLKKQGIIEHGGSLFKQGADGLIIQVGRVIDDRKSETPSVTQYITNGIEVLDEIAWDGKTIPIGVCVGKEFYLDSGKGSERKLYSLVRLARDPYMLYCYYRTTEAELVGMTPKTPYVGYEGQFEGHEAEWANVNRVPIPYLQAKPIVDAVSGQVLPLPRREAYEPAIQALEVGAEGARRAIQAAMGISSLPTAAQRQNQKSGVALERIASQQSQGSYHFIDNYDRFLQRMGDILNDLLPKVYDTARQIGIRKPDESYEVAAVNQETTDQQTGEKVVENAINESEHGITISTGPSFDSQRQQAQEFVEGFVQNPQVMQMALQDPKSSAAKIVSSGIKLLRLGPLGEEMSKAIYPEADEGAEIPPQVQQEMAQMQKAVQAINAHAEALEAENKRLQDERDLAQMNNDSKERIAAQNNETKLVIEELKADAARNQALVETGFAALSKRLDLLNARDAMNVQQQQAAAEQSQIAQAQAAQGQPPGA